MLDKEKAVEQAAPWWRLMMQKPPPSGLLSRAERQYVLQRRRAETVASLALASESYQHAVTAEGEAHDQRIIAECRFMLGVLDTALAAEALAAREGEHDD